MCQRLACFLIGLVLALGDAAVAGPPGPEHPKLPLRANKASTLTQEQMRERIVPKLKNGMTETELQKALGTLPVLTGNGELLWVLKDGIVLTASFDGTEESQIVCWLIRSDR